MPVHLFGGHRDASFSSNLPGFEMSDLYVTRQEAGGARTMCSLSQGAGRKWFSALTLFRLRMKHPRSVAPESNRTRHELPLRRLGPHRHRLRDGVRPLLWCGEQLCSRISATSWPALFSEGELSGR